MMLQYLARMLPKKAEITQPLLFVTQDGSGVVEFDRLTLTTLIKPLSNSNNTVPDIGVED